MLTQLNLSISLFWLSNNAYFPVEKRPLQDKAKICDRLYCTTVHTSTLLCKRSPISNEKLEVSLINGKIQCMLFKESSVLELRFRVQYKCAFLFKEYLVLQKLFLDQRLQTWLKDADIKVTNQAEYSSSLN